MTTVMIVGSIYTTCRNDFEAFENEKFSNIKQFIETTQMKNVRFFSLSEFVDAMNNEEIESSHHWFGYIRLESMEGIL